MRDELEHEENKDKGDIPVEEVVEGRVLRDIWPLKVIETEGIRLDERRDGLDGFWRIICFALLTTRSSAPKSLRHESYS